MVIDSPARPPRIIGLRPIESERRPHWYMNNIEVKEKMLSNAPEYLPMFAFGTLGKRSSMKLLTKGKRIWGLLGQLGSRTHCIA